MNFQARESRAVPMAVSLDDAEPLGTAPDPVAGVSTRAVLVLLAFAVVVPLLGFASYLIWREAQAERARYQAELSQTATQLSFVLDQQFSLLVTLLEGMASSPALAEGAFAKFHAQAVGLRGIPGVNISLRTAAGKMLVNARAGFGAPEVNITAVLDHDAELLRTRHAVMSNVFQGVTRGGFSFSAAYPVVQNDEIAYILQANLPTSQMASLLREFHLSEGADAFIIDRNNVFVAVSNGHETKTGKKYSYGEAPPAGDGIFRGVNAEGETIVGVIATSLTTGWRIGVTAREATLLAPANRALGDLAVMGLACTMIGLTLAFVIGRKISSSIQALALAGEALQRKEIDAPAPTPLREVNVVARSLAAASRRLRNSEARLRESEAWLQEALLAGRAFAFDLDIAADSISISGNAELLGPGRLPVMRISGADFRSRIHPADLSPAISAIMKLTPSKTAYQSRLRYLGPDGAYLWLNMRGNGRFDSSGSLVQVAGLAVDVTANARAEEAQARLAAIVESSRDMIISVAPGGRILTWNRGAERIFGYSEEEAVGRSLQMLIPNDFNDFRDLADAMEQRGSFQIETIRQTKDGRRINVRISAGSFTLPDGSRSSSAIVTDITERKRFEERQRTLINELNHRVKNTLATIQSIAAHTFRQQTDRGALHAFVARLMALSGAHNVLTRSNWGGAMLAEIVDIAIAPHQMTGGARFHCAGPAVHLQPRGALAISMALHELCTNAAKYGALSNDTGKIDIGWRIVGSDDCPHVLFSWVERDGPAVVEPAQAGFGTRLVRATLAEDLDADVQLIFENSGLVFSFDAPLPCAPAHSPQSSPLREPAAS